MPEKIADWPVGLSSGLPVAGKMGGQNPWIRTVESGCEVGACIVFPLKKALGSPQPASQMRVPPLPIHLEMSPVSPHSLALNKMPTLETENHTLPCSAPGPLAPSSSNFIVLHTSLRFLLLLEHGKLFSTTGPLNVPVSPLRILIAEVTHSGALSAISHQFTPLSIFFLFVPCRLCHFFF